MHGVGTTRIMVMGVGGEYQHGHGYERHDYGEDLHDRYGHVRE